MSIEGKRGMPRVRPPFPATKGLWEKPDLDQQRRDVRQRAVDRDERRQGVQLARHGEQQGHEGVRDGRQDPPRRPGRGADGDLHPRDRLRHLRRHPGRPEVQGRADGRAVGRLHPGRAAGHRDRLRVDQQDRRHHGLGRPRRHGRDHVHGGRRPVLPRVHAARVVRQVHVLPHRHQADARGAHAHHRGPGAGRRHRAARGPGGRA